MRTLLVTWGTEGDTRPVLALARGLQAAGHEVLVLADRAGAPLAADLAVPFEAMPGDFRELMQGEGRTGDMVRKGSSPVGTWLDLVGGFARPALRLVLDRLDDVDLLVGSSMCKIPAEVIARRRGVPTVGIDLQPFTPTREFPPPLLNVNSLPPAMNLPLYAAMNTAFAAIRNLALAPVIGRRPPSAPSVIPWRPHGTTAPVPQLGAWSPTLVPRPREWRPDKPVVTGELALEVPGQALDQRIVDFLDAGEPPVFVGLGSLAGLDLAEFRRVAVAALDGRRAVFSAGWNEFGDEDFGADVLPIGPAPFAELFPRCSVVVHHGGAGTSHLVARAGRPSVFAPQIADQAFWARQFQRLGMAPEPLRHGSLDVATFRSAIEQAERMQPRAAEVADEMSGEDGVATTVEFIESRFGRRDTTKMG